MPEGLVNQETDPLRHQSERDRDSVHPQTRSDPALSQSSHSLESTRHTDMPAPSSTPFEAAPQAEWPRFGSAPPLGAQSQRFFHGREEHRDGRLRNFDGRYAFNPNRGGYDNSSYDVPQTLKWLCDNAANTNHTLEDHHNALSDLAQSMTDLQSSFKTFTKDLQIELRKEMQSLRADFARSRYEFTPGPTGAYYTNASESPQANSSPSPATAVHNTAQPVETLKTPAYSGYQQAAPHTNVLPTPQPQFEQNRPLYRARRGNEIYEHRPSQAHFAPSQEIPRNSYLTGSQSIPQRRQTIGLGRISEGGGIGAVSTEIDAALDDPSTLSFRDRMNLLPKNDQYPKFDGDGGKLQQYLQNMDVFIAVNQIPEAIVLTKLSSRFTDEASRFYNLRVLDGDVPRTWNEWKIELRKRFFNIGWLREAQEAHRNRVYTGQRPAGWLEKFVEGMRAIQPEATTREMQEAVLMRVPPAMAMNLQSLLFTLPNMKLSQYFVEFENIALVQYPQGFRDDEKSSSKKEENTKLSQSSKENSALVNKSVSSVPHTQAATPPRVNVTRPYQGNPRQCFNCGSHNHIAATCPNPGTRIHAIDSAGGIHAISSRPQRNGDDSDDENDDAGTISDNEDDDEYGMIC
ncbi:hypothetical protein JCM5353_008627 [Sporobolomyces roseus]